MSNLDKRSRANKAALEKALQRSRITLDKLGDGAPTQVIDLYNVADLGSSYAVAQAMFPKCGTLFPVIKSKEEQSQEIKRFWKEVFEENRITLQDSHPYRIVVAYRFVKEVLAASVGESAHLTPLSILLSEDNEVDRWQKVEPENAPAIQKETSYAARLRSALFSGDDLIGLYPPRVSPDMVDDSGHLSDKYDPYTDDRLARWMKVFSLVAWRLRFGQPPLENPRLGDLSVRGLDDPEWIRFLWPQRYEVIQFEELLLEEISEQIAEKGIREASQYLRSHYGFSANEAGRVVEMAFSWLKGTLGRDLEEQRLLIASRLDRAGDAARRAGDTKGQLMALKQLATVLGVTKATPQDDVANFLEAVAQVASGKRELPEPKGD